MPNSPGRPIVVVVVVITSPLPVDGGTARTATQVHPINLNESDLGKDGSQFLTSHHWLVAPPPTRPTAIGGYPRVASYDMLDEQLHDCNPVKSGASPVCHLKMKVSRHVVCPRTQQASCRLVFYAILFFMLSAKQGSCEYHFLKYFGMARLRNEPKDYRLRSGHSNHYTIAAVGRPICPLYQGERYLFYRLRRLHEKITCQSSIKKLQ